jgi:glycosyltransferase involved in cell wall biosynthesis
MGKAVRAIYVAFERRAARASTRIITVSDSTMRKGLADRIGRPDQYVVIGPGIEIDPFLRSDADPAALRRQLGIPEGAVVVGTVSRLAPQKAPMDFLGVARHFRDSDPPVRFVFVGGGPQEPEFRREITRMGLDDIVVATGYRSDIPALITVFDIFLLNSLWEGLPAVIMEAMAAGLPIVATAVDGTPEIVEEGVTGYLAEPHDTAAMAERIRALALQPELRRRLGEAGAHRADPAFRIDEMVRTVCALYEELVAAQAQVRGITAAS